MLCSVSLGGAVSCVLAGMQGLVLSGVGIWCIPVVSHSVPRRRAVLSGGSRRARWLQHPLLRCHRAERCAARVAPGGVCVACRLCSDSVRSTHAVIRSFLSFFLVVFSSISNLFKFPAALKFQDVSNM